ncbi:MmgE/PrpD family protein [Chloroflexota bacterium]
MEIDTTQVKKTVITGLSDFAAGLKFEDLPSDVVDEARRIILDSIGCGLAGVTHDRSKAGLAFARQFGGLPQATVIGYGDRLSNIGAAFANGELINALDLDAVLPPGHVSPMVFPAPLAVGENLGSSGKELIVATALAHEMSFRFGKAMVNQRDVRDGKISFPAVMGYNSTIFGATAAVGKIKKFDTMLMANALGIAGSIAPVNSMTAWVKHAPSSTIKYHQLAGLFSFSAITAASLAQLGHRGDICILDDEWGFWRFSGSSKWEPEWLTKDLGTKWLFPPFQLYKPYPHCRILHGSLDALIHIVRENNIKPEEIESIHAWVEAFCMEPVWNNRVIENPIDAQFSVAHGLSLAAHDIPPGPEWQDMETVMDPGILKLMDRVTYELHPDYTRAIEEDPRSRLSRVAVKARGKTFTEERRYPKGTPSPIPETFFTTDELVAKFEHNAQRALPARKIAPAWDAILKLEGMDNISELMKLVSISPPIA